MPELTLIGISEAADENGNVHLLLVGADGRSHEAAVPAQLVNNLVQRFQTATIEAAMAASTTNYPHMPLLQVLDANLAHNPQTTELMVSIDQIGWVVLGCSDELLRHLRGLIDKALQHRQAPSARQ